MTDFSEITALRATVIGCNRTTMANTFAFPSYAALQLSPDDVFS
jgi:hypothetical protein